MRLALSPFLLITLLSAAEANDEGQERRFEPNSSIKPGGLTSVPQTGPYAEQIKDNLKKIRLPKGFKIELYAVVPDARYIAASLTANMVFVGTRRTTVWAISDRNGNMFADEVKPFAPKFRFKNPNGVCLTNDGSLIVVETNRVLSFPAAQLMSEKSEATVITVVPEGGLIPVEEQSPNHSGRTCKVSDDGKLYITLGQPYNVQPKEKIDLYNKIGIGGVISLNSKNGSGKEVYAIGMRNPAGMDINPRDKTIWTTDNQVDGLGDDEPPGELNRITKAGQHFGFPYWNGAYKVAGSTVAPDLKDIQEPASAIFPQVEFPAHQAQLGMSFYTGKQFPQKYQGGVFVAAHGSWNRTVPSGYLINFVPINTDGTAGKAEVFADGFIDFMSEGSRGNSDDGAKPMANLAMESDFASTFFRIYGRPVDVANLPDGSILVSDDFANALYRISYTGD